MQNSLLARLLGGKGSLFSAEYCHRGGGGQWLLALLIQLTRTHRPAWSRLPPQDSPRLPTQLPNHHGGRTVSMSPQTWLWGVNGAGERPAQQERVDGRDQHLQKELSEARSNGRVWRPMRAVRPYNGARKWQWAERTSTWTLQRGSSS